jgi:RimJ/RimL family protein N-acetyltransferase
MSTRNRWSAEWSTPVGRLTVLEPTREEVSAVAAPLVVYYNEPHNRAMMAHEALMTSQDVIDHFARVEADNGRPLLLYLDGRLMGDADLRHADGRKAECAIMIGDRSQQGKGLGTRFLTMVHAIAFSALGLECVYCSIIPANEPSQRLFKRIGYVTDDSPTARQYADVPDDLTYSLARKEFMTAHAAALVEIRLCERSLP